MRKRALLISLVLVGLVGCNGKSAAFTPPRHPITAPGEIGSRLPDFAVEGLRGEKISTANLHGKVVLIDFWATWCQPCRKEMPGYQKLLDKYGSRGFAVVGFKSSMMMDTEDPLRFATSIGVRYPLAVTTNDLLHKFGGIQGLPTTLLYDRQEILRRKVIGFEYTQTFETALKPLL